MKKTSLTKLKERALQTTLMTGIVLCCFSFTSQTLLQELRGHLAKAYSFYNNSNTLYMHSVVYGVPFKNPKTQLKLGTAEMYRDGYHFYSKALGREMYCEGKRAMVIQHHKKTVTLYQNFDVKRLMKEQALPVDSLLNQITDKDSLVSPDGKKGSYRIFKRGNNKAYTDLVFDEKDHYLKNYDYTLYSPEGEVRSEYSKIKVQYDQVSKKLPGKIDFNIDRFLEGNGNKMKVNEHLLKGYKLKVKKYYYDY